MWPQCQPESALARRRSRRVSEQYRYAFPLAILLGKGAGAFGKAKNFAVGTTPSSVAIGKLDGDSHVDLVVANVGFVRAVHDPGSVPIAGARFVSRDHPRIVERVAA